MKKIVALVLSLVMALSLATVAFATTKTVYYETTDLTDVTGLKAYEAKYVAGKTNSNGSGTIGYYTVKWNDTTTSYYVPSDKDHATGAIFENGAQVAWVKWVADNDIGLKNFYNFEASFQGKTTDLPNCTTTQYLVDGYKDGNGNFWVEDDKAVEKVAKVGNILVNVRAAYDEGISSEVIYAAHIFAKGVKNTTTGYDVATCLICKGEFACTNDNLVATKNGYKVSTGFAYTVASAKVVYDVNKYNNGYDFAWGQQYAGSYDYCWQLKAGTTEEAGTTKPDTTKDGVNSAKTFDAGIAMYVGMSLLSVAGSAVVIGKKKEF